MAASNDDYWDATEFWVTDKEATEALRRIGVQYCRVTNRVTTEKQRREEAAQAAREIMLKDHARWLCAACRWRILFVWPIHAGHYIGLRG